MVDKWQEYLERVKLEGRIWSSVYYPLVETVVLKQNKRGIWLPTSNASTAAKIAHQAVQDYQRANPYLGFVVGKDENETT